MNKLDNSPILKPASVNNREFTEARGGGPGNPGNQGIRRGRCMKENRIDFRNPKNPTVLNALTYGIYVEKPNLLKAENPDAYQALTEQMVGVLKPQDAVEMKMVENIVSFLFRMERLRKLETKLLNGWGKDWKGVDRGPAFALAKLTKDGDVFSKLSTQEMRLLNSFYRALKELTAYRMSVLSLGDKPEGLGDEHVDEQ